MQSKSPARSAGFTLIELMVVVVIATILLSIAVPSYMSQVRQSRRVDAKTAVLDLAGREENYFSTSGSIYSVTTTDLGYAAGGWPQNVAPNNYYTVTVCTDAAAGGAACTGTGNPNPLTAPWYYVVAVPAAASSQLNDTSCQIFGVDSTGYQWAKDSGGADSTKTCWPN
jgi:type IV pilus assembly protein PilE